MIGFSVYALRCGGDDHTAEGLPQVIYEGDASDEALERFWAKVPSATPSTTSGAVLSSPSNGAVLPAATPPTLRWMLATASRLADPQETTYGSRRIAPARWLEIAPAHAHLPPVTGMVYLVELRTSAGEAAPSRLFTTNTEWTLDATTWSALKAAKKPVEVTIWNGYLNQNVVEEGPFVSAKTTFTIE